MAALDGIVDIAGGQLYPAEQFSLPPLPVVSLMCIAASLCTNRLQKWEGIDVTRNYKKMVQIRTLWDTDFSQTNPKIKALVSDFLCSLTKKHLRHFSSDGMNLISFFRSLPAIWDADEATQTAVMKLKKDVHALRPLEHLLTRVLQRLMPGPEAQGTRPPGPDLTSAREAYIEHKKDWEEYASKFCTMELASTQALASKAVARRKKWDWDGLPAAVAWGRLQEYWRDLHDLQN